MHFLKTEQRIQLTTALPSLLVSAFVLVGCGDRSEDRLKQASTQAQTKAVSQPKPGGVLTIANTTDPKAFNPITAKETSTTNITGYFFEGLTRTHPVTTEVEPWLAVAWDISEDGLTWTFHLREDVFWSDGEPFTAEDVVFTFEQLIFNPDVPSSARDIFTIGGQRVSVRAVDAHTVEFQLPVVFAPFLRAMGQEILPAHRLQASVKAKEFASTWGLNAKPDEIVGTGAFRLMEYVPGQHVRLQRNPHYWRFAKDGTRLPYLEEVRILFVQNLDVALLKFQEGELDVYGLRPSDYAILKPDEAKGDYTVYEMGPAFGTNFIFFNQNPGIHPTTQQSYVPMHKLRWFRDLVFRRAVAHAVDKQSIIDIVMSGLGYPQDAAMSPSAGFFYHEHVPTYDYDLDKAKQLLEQAGYTDRDGNGIIEDTHGTAVEFNLFTNAGNTDRVQIANIMRKDLEKLGMKVHFTQLEFNTLVNKIDASFDWDAILLGLTGGIEPHFARNVWHSSGQLHMWYPRQSEPATEWEAEIDRIFDQGVQELDRDKRKEYYDRWQVIVAEQLPLIYTALPPSLSAVRNRFGNLNPTPYGGVLHNVEELYIMDE